MKGTTTISWADSFFENDSSVRVRTIWRDRLTGRYERHPLLRIPARRSSPTRSSGARRVVRTVRTARTTARSRDPDEPPHRVTTRRRAGSVSMVREQVVSSRRADTGVEWNTGKTTPDPVQGQDAGHARRRACDSGRVGRQRRRAVADLARDPLPPAAAGAGRRTTRRRWAWCCGCADAARGAHPLRLDR